jgi:hypothetical protein
MHRSAFLALVTSALASAGCLGDDGPSPPGAEPPPEEQGVLYAPGNWTSYRGWLEPALAFETRLIDPLRAGGEPVMAVMPSGTIVVAAHPGWTHYHPTLDEPDPSELVAPANGQSYLWRSTDAGMTWTHVGAAGTSQGPRSTGTGASDPDFTVDGTGRIWYTDLQALAEQSVSYSDDDGRTWAAGNVVAGAGPYVDRQWMASHGDRVYLTANYFQDRSAGQSPDGERPISTTDDDGLTWRTVGYAPCGGDFLADPRDGALVLACGLGVAISLDGGATWAVRPSPAGVHRGFFAHEPAIDTAGGIFLAANGQPLTPHDPNRMLVSYTPDRGATWDILDLGPLLNDTLGAQGTHVFAWVTAGGPGNAAVSWIATDRTGTPSQLDGAEWHVYSAFLSGLAGNGTPEVRLGRVTSDPVHVGPMCSSGTVCQAQSVALDPVMGTDAGDRRMGDFFETTLDRDGRLLLAFADTHARPDDVISHPRFARQVGGPLLFDPAQGWPTGWPTQG